MFIALGEAARCFGALAAVLMAPPPGQPASGDAPDPPAQARAQSHGIADGSSDSDEPGGAPAPPKKKAKGAPRKCGHCLKATSPAQTVKTCPQRKSEGTSLDTSV